MKLTKKDLQNSDKQAERRQTVKEIYCFQWKSDKPTGIPAILLCHITLAIILNPQTYEYVVQQALLAIRARK